MTTNYGSITTDPASGTPALEPVVSKIEVLDFDGTLLFFRITLVNLNPAAGPVTNWVRLRQGSDELSGPFSDPFPVESPELVVRKGFVGFVGDADYRIQTVATQGDEEPDWTKSAQAEFKTVPLVARWPAKVTATPGDGEITVNWRPPIFDGGRPVTGYLVAWAPRGGDFADAITSPLVRTNGRTPSSACKTASNTERPCRPSPPLVTDITQLAIERLARFRKARHAASKSRSATHCRRLAISQRLGREPAHSIHHSVEIGRTRVQRDRSAIDP